MSMRISAVDSLNDLFLVEDFYPQEIIDQINQTNFLTYKYEPVLVQGQYTRRNIKSDRLLNKLSKLSSSAIPELIKQSNINITLLGCGFWLDTENYYMDKHIDALDHVSAGMQIYIKDAAESLGTCFYNEDGSVRYQFSYKANTGYFMVNNKHQIHAMPVAIPKEQYRFSVYHWLKLK